MKTLFMVMIPINIGKNLPFWVPGRLDRNGDDPGKKPSAIFNGLGDATFFETKRQANAWVKKSKAYWAKHGGDRGEWLVIRLIGAPR